MPDLTATDVPDAVEAAARAHAGLEPGEEWPSNEDLGGHPLLGTRDDEYRDGMHEQAAELLDAALPALRAALRVEWERGQEGQWGVRRPTGDVARCRSREEALELAARWGGPDFVCKAVSRGMSAGPWVEVTE